MEERKKEKENRRKGKKNGVKIPFHPFSVVNISQMTDSYHFIPDIISLWFLILN